jgi:hypothetical protein
VTRRAKASDDRLTYFINVYEMDRHYGGPEEGGWWYDSGTLVQTRKVRGRQRAVRIATLLRCSIPVPQHPLWSVLYAGGQYSISIDRLPGKSFPTTRPHYE